MLLDLARRQSGTDMKSGSTCHLREDPLKEHLHDSAGIREDRLDDLCFLADGGTDLLEESLHAWLGRRWRHVRVTDGLPSAGRELVPRAGVGITHMSILIFPSTPFGPSTSTFSASSRSRSFEMKKSC